MNKANSVLDFVNIIDKWNSADVRNGWRIQGYQEKFWVGFQWEGEAEIDLKSYGCRKNKD